MRSYTEEEIVSGLRLGDNDVLHYTYKMYWPTIRKFVLLNNGTIQDAEEIYQDGIIALYEKTKDQNFKLTCALKTYIYSICRNKWLAELRSRKKVLDIEEYITNVQHESQEKEPLLPQSLEMADVISKLGDPCHTLLLGYYYEKLSLEALAKKMNYQNANVTKQQKFRCIERLKRMFTNDVKLRQQE